VRSSRPHAPSCCDSAATDHAACCRWNACGNGCVMAQDAPLRNGVGSRRWEPDRMVGMRRDSVESVIGAGFGLITCWSTPARCLQQSDYRCSCWGSLHSSVCSLPCAAPARHRAPPHQLSMTSDAATGSSCRRSARDRSRRETIFPQRQRPGTLLQGWRGQASRLGSCLLRALARRRCPRRGYHQSRRRT
jgi:hypothetical protein